ncbi:hypothetical protein B0T21DRAFT_145363 [Apiosordaria backusii]|uniref:Uncharacterized protein n=1 Tax=Apiosordaria backusii TaxID=314023 RepID=A0AA40BSL1_9PEZI|nr:hypothetical protein B0T21DRAFT_145363 [Apiosordaria backusii]
MEKSKPTKATASAREVRSQRLIRAVSRNLGYSSRILPFNSIKGEGGASRRYIWQWFGVLVWQNLVFAFTENTGLGEGGLSVVFAVFSFFGYVLLFYDRISPSVLLHLFLFWSWCKSTHDSWTAFYPLIYILSFFFL